MSSWYRPFITFLLLGFVWLPLLRLIQPAEAAKTLDVSLEKGQLLLTPRHGGDGMGWGKEKCVACHFLNSIHKEAPNIRSIVDRKGFETCTGCHGQNGTQAVRQCAICHNGKDLPDSPLLQGKHTHDFSVQEVKALNDANCMICHVSSDMDGTFEPDVDLTLPKQAQQLEIPFQNVSEFCVRCHNQNHQQPGFPMQARFPRDPLVTMDLN